MSNQTYFVTGATGYLGNRVVRALLAEGKTVFCLRRAVSNMARINDIAHKVMWLEAERLMPPVFFRAQKIDCIIHCATHYGRKQVDPIQTIEANLILPLKLLHAAAGAGVKSFISTDTLLDKRINNYSLSKAQFTDWLASYADKITGIDLAIEHFYGPDDDPTKFATYIVQSLLDGVAEIPLTAGEQQRDFIYIDDVVAAVMTVAQASATMPTAFYRYEVGTGNPVTIRSFVDQVKALSGNTTTRLDYGALPYRKNEVMEAAINLSGLAALGWEARVPLAEGLRTTIAIEQETRGKTPRQEAR